MVSFCRLQVGLVLPADQMLSERPTLADFGSFSAAGVLKVRFTCDAEGSVLSHIRIKGDIS